MGETIFFDMDGTLLDTEKYYRKYWKLAAKECGYTMTDEQALSLRSLGRPFAIDVINGFFQDENAYHRIRDTRMKMMGEALKKDGIPLKPYAEETLKELQARGHHLGIATATDLARTESYLEEVGLRKYLEHIVCATMVKCGKPAPDIYQYACEQVQLPPEAVYAVEDSPNGVLSAYRAGCKVIMIPDQTQPDEELMKYITKKVDSLRELLSLFDINPATDETAGAF